MLEARNVKHEWTCYHCKEVNVFEGGEPVIILELRAGEAADEAGDRAHVLKCRHCSRPNVVKIKS